MTCEKQPGKYRNTGEKCSFALWLYADLLERYVHPTTYLPEFSFLYTDVLSNLAAQKRIIVHAIPHTTRMGASIYSNRHTSLASLNVVAEAAAAPG